MPPESRSIHSPINTLAFVEDPVYPKAKAAPRKALASGIHIVVMGFSLPIFIEPFLHSLFPGSIRIEFEYIINTFSFQEIPRRPSQKGRPPLPGLDYGTSMWTWVWLMA